MDFPNADTIINRLEVILDRHFLKSVLREERSWRGRGIKIHLHHRDKPAPLQLWPTVSNISPQIRWRRPHHVHFYLCRCSRHFCLLIALLRVHFPSIGRMQKLQCLEVIVGLFRIHRWRISSVDFWYYSTVAASTQCSSSNRTSARLVLSIPLSVGCARSVRIQSALMRLNLEWGTQSWQTPKYVIYLFIDWFLTSLLLCRNAGVMKRLHFNWADVTSIKEGIDDSSNFLPPNFNILPGEDRSKCFLSITTKLKGDMQMAFKSELLRNACLNAFRHIISRREMRDKSTNWVVTLNAMYKRNYHGITLIFEDALDSSEWGNRIILLSLFQIFLIYTRNEVFILMHFF